MRVTSQAALNDAVELIKNGASALDACFAHDITIGSLQWHLKKTGIKIRDIRPLKRRSEKHNDAKFLGRYTKEEVIEIAIKYNSWKIAANIMGSSHDAIRNWAYKNDLRINRKKQNKKQS